MEKKTKLLLLVLFLAVCVGMCRSIWVEDVAEEEDTNSKSDHKFSQSLGLENVDAASKVTDTIKSEALGASEYASQKATDTKEAISEATIDRREKASEDYNGIGGDEFIKMITDKVLGAIENLNTASDKASNTAGNAKANIGDAMGHGREGAANVYDQGKQKVNMASDIASEKVYDVKDTMENAKDKASNVYDEAMQKTSDFASSNNIGYDEAMEKIKIASHKMYEEAKKGMKDMVGDKDNDVKRNIGCESVEETFDRVGEAYISSRMSMDEEAKANYEAAKEKASEATGNIGAKMRNTP